MLQPIVLQEIANYMKCQPEEISLDMRLDNLGIDSLGAITILYELEDKLGIEVPNEVFGSLHTVGDILTQLEMIVHQRS